MKFLNYIFKEVTGQQSLIGKAVLISDNTQETSGGGVQTVTGTAVDNTDPLNPIVNAPDLSGYVTDSELTTAIGSVNQFSETKVRETVATGLTDIIGTMSATDTFLTLFGKIKKALSDFGTALGLKADKTSQSAITYGASIAIDFAQTDVVRTLALTGNVTFTTSNRTATKEKVIIITASGADRTLTFPSGWIWTSPIPTNVLSGKTGVLYLYAKGTAETDILASYAPQTN